MGILAVIVKLILTNLSLRDHILISPCNTNEYPRYTQVKEMYREEKVESFYKWSLTCKLYNLSSTHPVIRYDFCTVLLQVFCTNILCCLVKLDTVWHRNWRHQHLLTPDKKNWQTIQDGCKKGIFRPNLLTEVVLKHFCGEISPSRNCKFLFNYT